MIKILIAEDDTLFAQTLEDFLSEEGFAVTLCHDGATAHDLCYEEAFDLLLLDINMPQLNGLELLQRVREARDTTPAIYLTSYRDKATMRDGFETGADDFLKKPVDLEELLMRIYALLRRTHKLDDCMQIGAFCYDKQQKVLRHGAEEITLTRKVAALLDLLTENPNRIVPTETIKSRLWGWDENPSDGALRVYINELKKVLGKAHIENIKGVGYRLAL